MRALVTGSTGFLGSTLVAALRQRDVEVLGLRRSTSPDDALEGLHLTPVVGDILEPETLPAAMEGVDWVFHVAAMSDHRHAARDVLYRINVDGARNIFEAALKAGVKRVIFTSSCAALGVPRPDKPLMDELDSFNLPPEEFPYGHSKHMAEQVMADYLQRGLNAVSVLPAAVIGPRDLKFISGELIIQALKGAIPALPRGGLNYIDVRDCMEGHIAAAERGTTGGRYVLGGHNMTHRETLEIVRDVLGTRVPPVDIPSWLLPITASLFGLLQKLMPGLPVNREALLMGGRQLYYDNSKAVRELGLKTRPFAESVRDAYQWYADNGYLTRRGAPAAPMLR